MIILLLSYYVRHKKFITIDGKLQKNPEWLKQQGLQQQTSDQKQQVTVVPTVTDMVENDLPMTTETLDAVEFIQDKDFLERYKLADGSVPDADQILSLLEKLFESYEIPVGQLNKLLCMVNTGTSGEVILDDSGSMSQVMTSGSSKGMTRWNEAVDTLRFITQVFSILRLPLHVRGLNRNEMPTKDKPLNGLKTVAHEGRTIQEVSDEWKTYCDSLLSEGPTCYATPTRSALKTLLKARKDHASIYLIFDGCPSDTSTDDMCKLLLERASPSECPITMIGCTDKDEDLEWASEVEEQGCKNGLSYLSTMDEKRFYMIKVSSLLDSILRVHIRSVWS